MPESKWLAQTTLHRDDIVTYKGRRLIVRGFNTHGKNRTPMVNVGLKPYRQEQVPPLDDKPLVNSIGRTSNTINVPAAELILERS
jgi:hypothetical protein